MANNVDPDQMPHYAASDLGLRCLLKPVCPSTLRKCGGFSQAWAHMYMWYRTR